MKGDRDPFWDNEARVEEAKWNWPKVAGRLIFWLAVCFIVYVAVRYG